MSWFVYIVECRDKSFYTGICWNLKKRIKEHNEGFYHQSKKTTDLSVDELLSL